MNSSKKTPLDLDVWPIIEQSVERISHANRAEELVEMGRDIESVVFHTQ